MNENPNPCLSFSVPQLPQRRQVSALHIPHSEMVHGKARGNVPLSCSTPFFCCRYLSFFFSPCDFKAASLFFGPQQRSNIPCHLQDISCGLTCHKTLPCEMHRCRRICHRSDCLGGGSCLQPCALPRPDCGHPCCAPCHKGASCPRSTCSAKVRHTAGLPGADMWGRLCRSPSYSHHGEFLQNNK